MFKNVASDILGTSDIGKIIDPKDYALTQSDDFILNEDQEKIYFLIQSKTDEYCFTNLALIHIDGTSAISKKRLLKRYDYKYNTISNVTLETAGTIDLDVEIKFMINNQNFSIDVQKSQAEQLKDLYKALIRISHIMHDNATQMSIVEKSIETTIALKPSRLENNSNLWFVDMQKFYTSTIKDARKNYIIADFGYVFEKYINN